MLAIDVLFSMQSIKGKLSLPHTDRGTGGRNGNLDSRTGRAVHADDRVGKGEPNNAVQFTFVFGANSGSN